jgi:LysR family transcriptional regulator (chromosome initiation inhibitor)
MILNEFTFCKSASLSGHRKARHGAGAELHLTQTGVTQRIRAIEKELGTTLFLRSRRGMQLTQEGEALLRYCRGSLDLEGEALSQIQGGGKDRPVFLTLAGPTSVMAARMADLCAGLYQKWPELYLNFSICDAADRLQMLRTGKASLSIVPPEQVPLELDSKKLRPDKYVLVASSRWRGRRLSEILAKERVIDFGESDPTTLNYLKKFGLAAELKRPRLFANSNEVIINFFRRGIGFGTLTQETAKPYLDSGALIALNSGSMMEDSLALVWFPRPELPSYLKDVIQAIR